MKEVRLLSQCAPALLFYNTHLPESELTEALHRRAVEAGKIPPDQAVAWWKRLHELEYDGITEVDEIPAGYVVFPMTAEDFHRYGIFLLEWLHALAAEQDPDTGNCFLSTYTRSDGIPWRPAGYVSAALFYTREGQSWRNALYERID